MTPGAGDSGRLVIVTNGNFFARVILGPLIHDRGAQIAGIVVITGVKSGKSRLASIAEIRRRGGWRHFGYKLATYAVFSVASLVLPGRKFFVHQLARERGIPVLLSAQVNTRRVIDAVSGWRPDLLVSVSCPQRIGAAILSVPTAGAINIHSSLLPAYAGISPYFWVLANGESRTGTTVHVMEEQFDRGAILVQKPLAIHPRESVFSLFFRLSELGAKALSEAVDGILEGTARPLDQDAAKRSYYSWPTTEAAAELRRRGHRFARLGEMFAALRVTRRDGPAATGRSDRRRGVEGRNP